MPHLLDFLKSAQPDVLCLQEIKCLADDFPRLEVQALGYRVECMGQRAYNGVALVSKEPPRDVVTGLPGFDDQQARYIEAAFSGGTGEEVRVGSLYLPNGNPIGTDKFTYKLAWMERLHDRAEDLLKHEIPFVLAGDYNICPTDEDVYDPVALRDDALCQPELRGLGGSPWPNSGSRRRRAPALRWPAAITATNWRRSPRSTPRSTRSRPGPRRNSSPQRRTPTRSMPRAARSPSA